MRFRVFIFVLGIWFNFLFYSIYVMKRERAQTGARERARLNREPKTISRGETSLIDMLLRCGPSLKDISDGRIEERFNPLPKSFSTMAPY